MKTSKQKREQAEAMHGPEEATYKHKLWARKEEDSGKARGADRTAGKKEAQREESRG
jgi:hypothetical protein